MKAGTKIKYELITDSRFETDILAKINDLFNQLCNEIEGTMKVDNLHAIAPYLINWEDGDQQYRMDCYLTTLIPMSKEQIYTITNKVQARKLKFITPKVITFNIF